MVPQPGAHDNGVHEYEFAFRQRLPHELGKAVELGRRLNQPPMALVSTSGKAPAEAMSLASWNADNVALSSLRQAADGGVDAQDL